MDVTAKRETYNAFAASWWIAPTLVWYSSCPLFCPPLSTTLHTATHSVKFTVSFVVFFFSFRRDTRRNRSQGWTRTTANLISEISRLDASNSVSISTLDFTLDQSVGEIYWKYDTSETRCRSWIVNLCFFLFFLRCRLCGRWEGVDVGTVELYVASPRRTNLGLRWERKVSEPSNFNQLTGNYHGINHFCASLHESLDNAT